MRLFSKFRLILLSAALFAVLSLSAYAVDANPIVRVGLYYGSTALESANLSYEIGDAYRLGYYDSNNNFTALQTITNKRITVLKASDYAFSGGSFLLNGQDNIGRFHAELSAAVDTPAEAADILKTAQLIDKSAYIAYIDGTYRVRMGSYTTRAEAASAVTSLSLSGAPDTKVALSSSGYRVVSTETGSMLFEFSNGSTPLGIETVSSDGQAACAWHKNEIYPGGFIFSYSPGSNITVINVLRVQDYIKGVVPYEINPNWPVEAQKAQGLCAKNYALANLNRHSSSGFDICNTIHCQVYRGIRAATELSNSACDAVAGQYITHNGSIISAYYHSSNGGSTESAKNVWGTEVPYLQPVVDDYENINSIPNGTWRKEISAAEMTNILRSKGVSTTDIVEAYVETFTPAGNVYKLTFINANGQPLSYTGEKARTILGTYTISQRFTISPKSGLYVQNGAALSGGLAQVYAIGAGGSVARVNQQSSRLVIMTGSGKKTGVDAGGDGSTYIIEGRGFGHNVGMSQYGAKGMAEAGFTYDQIIKHYFTGVEITNVG